MKFAYVTVIGLVDENDYVVQFSTQTFKETARAKVGKDSHLFIRAGNPNLYVSCQTTNQVFALKRKNLKQVKVLDITGAHGVFMNKTGSTLYTTNIGGGGIDAIYTIDTIKNKIQGNPVSATFPTPHNVVLNGDDTKLYVTHSGSTSDKVTVFDIPCQNCEPIWNKTIDVGINPFGIGFIP